LAAEEVSRLEVSIQEVVDGDLAAN